MFSGGVVLVAEVGDYRAEIGSSYEAELIDVEPRAHLLVGDGAVNIPGLRKRDLSDVASESSSRRIKPQVLHVGALIVMRAVQLRRRDCVSTSRDVAPGNESSHDVSAVPHAVLEIRTDDCCAGTKYGSERRVRVIANRRRQNRADDSRSIAKGSLQSCREVVRQRLDGGGSPRASRRQHTRALFGGYRLEHADRPGSDFAG